MPRETGLRLGGRDSLARLARWSCPLVRSDLGYHERSGMSNDDPGPELAAERLIAEYAESRRRRRSLAVAALLGIASALAAAMLLEHALFGTDIVLSGSLVAVAVVLALGLGLAYSSLVFYLGYSFASYRVEKGQIRPSLGQVLGILAAALFASSPLGLGLLEGGSDTRLVVVFAMLLWHNAALAGLGYGVRFYVQMRIQRERHEMAELLRSSQSEPTEPS